MSMKLSKPHRYPSSRLPSTHGVLWSKVSGGGVGNVFPKSIIHTPALPVRSCMNSRELPTTCGGQRRSGLYKMDTSHEA